MRSWFRDPATGLSLPLSSRPTTAMGSRADMTAIVADDLKQLLVDILHDKPGHAMAVAGGQFHWRAVFSKEYGACFEGNRGQCDEIADTMFRIIEQTWRRKYPGESARVFLDAVYIPSPLSDTQWQVEVDEAWELEIAGSEDAMRQFYEGSARTRKGKDLGAKTARVGQIG